MFTSLKNSLTIVIPCYNEENYLGKTLESIYNQEGVRGLNVLIADGGSTDSTKDIIKYYKVHYKGRLNIREIKGGKVSRGRNEGLKYVKTKYVLFLDADSVLIEEDNLKYNVEKMEKENLDLLTGQVVGGIEGVRLKIGLKLFNYINRILSRYSPFAVGGYFMSRVDRVREYGGFNEEVTTSEDFLLSRQYRRNKFYISKKKYGQDDRRFKKMGYIGMIRLMIGNFINRNNIEYFKRDVGYW
jgi:glycosyltransferase involved in cell wall biosynthesis